MSERPPAILLVAGTDPSSGAGLPADARVCRDHSCWPLPVVTAIVVQSTIGVASFKTVSPTLLEQQWRQIVADIEPAAIKIGMIGSPRLARVIGRLLADVACPVVVDPVLASGHGDTLAQENLAASMVEHVFPHATVATPNLPEAVLLAGGGTTPEKPQQLHPLADLLLDAGPKAILLKGGHLPQSPGDLLARRDGHEWLVNRNVVPDLDVHGTGCHLASAIACQLAANQEIGLAVEHARAYLARLVATSRWTPGRGREIFGWNE